MAAPVIETCHVACCANRTPNVVSWSRGGTIAFGTCNSVALYDPQVGTSLDLQYIKVYYLYLTVLLFFVTAPESHLVSGGSDNRLILWEAQNEKFGKSVECEGHTGPISAVAAIYTEGSGILVASSASDSTVRLWLYTDNRKAECLHIISFGSGFMMDVSLALLPGSRVPILACGGDDSRVHLYVQSKGELQKVKSLQGHEDWIRGVEWASIGGELLLASCSQDCLIRVWKLFAKSGTDIHTEDDHTIIKMKEDVFEVKERDMSSVFAVSLETVLAGHENWVYGVHWQPPSYKGGELQQPLSLLSASMDKTMILWAPEEGSGVWVEQGVWRPGVVISGHFNAVQDLSWDPEGEFILSVGSDQTTRLFTPWRKQDATWHEISRPQIHGYDMQCLAMVGRFQFVSGADEKVLRVFQAPRNFVENFANISGMSLEKLLTSSDSANLPEGASTPALGLSNKAVFQGKILWLKPRFFLIILSFFLIKSVSYFHPLNLTEPPPEDHLLQNTLWPEVQKLYGHGFEMFCLASDSARTVVASACKASKVEHAAVLLWSTGTWRQLQTLPCHSLTVTQMAFSPDAQLLLAVSRDRTWSLWRRNLPSPEKPQFSLHAHTGKDTAVHSRIIWSCDWSPDSKYFVTSSRDKKVIFRCWIKPCSSLLDVGDSATAVAFCPVLCSDNSYLLAVGLECGRILLYRWSPGQEAAGRHDWSSCAETDVLQSHALAVKRLRWRPRAGRAESEAEEKSSWVQLASASADHSVKIFNVNKLAL
uniref:Elongator complex protein 2 n=1 Tax=Scophthalmus maximus TaxID=52904 RepID=A0A8D3DQ99_SCOMX